MIGSHADVVLSDMITKNEFNNFNVTMAMEACWRVANTYMVHDSRWNPPTYINYTYIP
jgi:hypothetical protein